MLVNPPPTFNLGWALAEAGNRVLIVDCDPQCNLTGMVLALKGLDDLGDFYESTSFSQSLYGSQKGVRGITGENCRG
nr:AAA family ATPase [Burkholderia gladioli]